ncbi:nitroreductase family protein [Acidomonas methanolica]|uniref:Nitroreductase n=1 Tax=Acidomonas methanolica NBRC 104435 TaxID=1231351 RepID=A0A023D3I5_ACIMT|nr:nitroreductase family protein [Acidomonas methanolica]MBU2654415.1 nitroreductase family protein [Acidomonas methanolica]TCS28505.1 nitroreductase [Acidomonas methanolica]GAJ28649.1 nitroreductase [Acidomonas methanolica NBRC 104435]GBQ48175.1 nitroreductase [Acidomonas methanolica]GEK99547.1 nitroreductase [Acidomonas methanolica NBRC 104435]
MTKAPSRAEKSTAAPFILDRWSPRAFEPVEISVTDLLGLLEAGRWAPSAYNSQPWRFLYARRGTPDWDRFLSWLIPFNQSWASNASAIVYIASHMVMTPPGGAEPVPSPTHAFDAGAASAMIELQAAREGWATHPMSGFDGARARAGLELPEDYALHAAVAIGRQGKAEALPEGLRAREVPSDRVPLDTLVFEGRFPS